MLVALLRVRMFASFSCQCVGLPMHTLWGAFAATRSDGLLGLRVQTAAECAAFLAFCPGVQPLPRALLEAVLLVWAMPALPMSTPHGRQSSAHHRHIILRRLLRALCACNRSLL